MIDEDRVIDIINSQIEIEREKKGESLYTDGMILGLNFCINVIEDSKEWGNV